jgi:LuxR family transcriptional regulator, maltose regulon positive regulatory protein
MPLWRIVDRGVVRTGRARIPPAGAQVQAHLPCAGTRPCRDSGRGAMLGAMVATALIDTAPSRLGARWRTQCGAAVLQRPLAPTVIRRRGLVRALQEQQLARVVTLVAPAGYGKTTVLREWADHDLRPFAWVTLDRRHDDAHRLLAAVARAVEDAVGEVGDLPFVLVLDNVDCLASRSAIRALRAVAVDLPPEATLVVASRREPPLPLARMRVERGVAQLGPRELALTRADAAALMKAVGHELERDETETLLQLTEGWPVGVALAAQFLDERGTAADLRRFGGADRLVAAYVRDEILDDLPPEHADLLMRTSVLDVLSAPACDALLERAGSGAILAALAAAGLLVPLDRTDERFRHHRIIGAALRAELRRSAPTAEPVLHARASAWHQRTGDVDRAVQHALLGGDVRAASDIVWANLPAAVAQGRLTALERWLAGFSRAQLAAHPPLAVAAAVRELMMGQGHLMQHWTSVAAVARKTTRRAAADVDPAVALLRAVVGEGGPRRMRADAERAYRAQPEDGPWRSLCSLVAGTAARLLGDASAAAARLEEGARRAAVSAPQVQALCLAELAVLAFERDDWEGAAVLVTRARSQVDRYGLGQYGTTALVFAASAVIRAHRGRVDAAREDLQEAVRLQHALTDFAPCYDADVSVLVARAALRLSDLGVAQDHLAHAARVLDRVPEAIGLRHAAEEAQRQLDSFEAAGRLPTASMTGAELRILRFLPTHLSFREIGERTFVSANTVKTQANAVYRKLDVSCRSGAGDRVRACGLLDG